MRGENYGRCLRTGNVQTFARLNKKDKIMKGDLTDHAAYCGHQAWWHNALMADRKPFALPGTEKRYAPDVLVHVHHVKLFLRVDPENKTLSGLCHTTFEPIGQDLDTVFFEAQGLNIESVTFAGGAQALQFETSEQGLTVRLPRTLRRGEKQELAIAYHLCDPKAGIYFTGPSPVYPDKPYQVWTQGQDEDAHFWYPVVAADYPNHKMTTEVIATVPAKYTALSNGKLVLESEDKVSGTKTYHWLQDRPHVSYLVTLVVGVYVKLQENYKDLPVEIYVDPSLLDRAREYFKGTADLVALFSRLDGVEYPWNGKYSQVMVQDFIFGGMENTTMTTMTDRILSDSSVRDEYRLAEIRLNAHELRHHWWGDFITCREWPHAWLNEGSATYGEVEAVEHFFGKKERDYYVKGLADQYFSEDGRYRRPIVCFTYKEPIDLFDSTLYKKGALVRHMLRYLLGDEGYYRSMKTFLTDNAYQCVDTHDFIKAIEKATGRNMRSFFDQWVFGAGFPEYKVSYSWDGKNRVATVKVSQTQKLEEGTGLFSMPIRFSFTTADGKTQDFTVEVKDKESSFNFAVDSKPVMFRFDPENWVLKRLDLTAVPKGMLIHQLNNDPEVMGRVQAAQTLGKLGGLDAVDALEQAVNSTFFRGVSMEAATALGAIATPAARDALLRCAKHSLPQVRRAVVSALGNFKHEAVAELLAGIITGGKETSSFVLADAAVALGKTKSDQAFAALEAALKMTSWQEVVRVGALNGLAELGDARAADLAIEHAAAGRAWSARPAAIAALGKLAKKAPRALEALHNLADSEETEQFTLRMSLIGALGEAKSSESRQVLNRMSRTATDGRVKRAITETLSKLDESKGAAQSLEALKTEVENLSGQVKALTERLDKKAAARPRRGKKTA